MLSQLVEENKTVPIVEQHLDVIKCADWIIDLGPGGSESGGHIVDEGTPKTIANNPQSLRGGCNPIPEGLTEINLFLDREIVES